MPFRRRFLKEGGGVLNISDSVSVSELEPESNKILLSTSLAALPLKIVPDFQDEKSVSLTEAEAIGWERAESEGLLITKSATATGDE